MKQPAEIDSILRHTWPNSEDVQLAVKTSPPSDNTKIAPGFVWLGGFKSDMAGTKAQTMVEQAAHLGCSSLRFDYSGHGISSGEFTAGTISRWVDESLTVLKEKTEGPQILVGSSMGGWIALRVAQELKRQNDSEKLAGLLLIAPAPDFTVELMEPQFSDAQQTALEEVGYFDEPTEYSDEPNRITRVLIKDGRNNLVLNSDISVSAPVRILQGMADPDVPYDLALRLIQALPDDDVALTLIKNGDHRLSRPQDITLLQKTMSSILEDVA